jgi:hypothetical protein
VVPSAGGVRCAAAALSGGTTINVFVTVPARLTARVAAAVTCPRRRSRGELARILGQRESTAAHP